MTLIDNIKAGASKKNISIARIEKTLGFGKNTIYRWDKNSPSLDKVIAVANLLELPISSLVTSNFELPPNEHLRLISSYERLSVENKNNMNAFLEIASLHNQYDTSGKASSSEISEPQPPYPNRKAKRIAVLGKVSAGVPIEGISVPLGYIDTELDADYALIAKGDSMEPVILDSEYIHVASVASLQNSEIGIFFIDGDIICKRYEMEDSTLSLCSFNSLYRPLKFSLTGKHDFKIQGKVLLTQEQRERLAQHPKNFS